MENQGNLNRTGQWLRRGFGMLLALVMLASTLSIPGFAWIEAETDVKAGSSEMVAFSVPEAIYLKPGENNFGTFVTPNGTASTGTVSFSMVGATNAVLRWEVLTGGSKTATGGQITGTVNGTGFINRASGQQIGAGATGQMTAKINSGSLNFSTMETAGNVNQIKWTVSYDKTVGTDTHGFQTVAFTTVYSPYLGEAGMVGHYANKGATNLEYIVHDAYYSFLTGVHNIGGGTRARNFSHAQPSLVEYTDKQLNVPGGQPNDTSWGTPFNYFFSESPNGGVEWWNVESGSGSNYAYPSGDTGGGGLPTAYITIDTSIYHNLNEVPNLSAGLVTLYQYWKSNAGGHSPTPTLEISAPDINVTSTTWRGPSNKNSASLDTFTNGLWVLNGAVKSGVSKFEFTTHMYWIEDFIGLTGLTYPLNVHQYVNLDVNTVDKTALRRTVAQAVGMQKDLDTSIPAATQTANSDLNAELEKAMLVLGDPTAPQTQIDSARSGLQAKIDAVRDTMSEAAPVIADEGVVVTPESVYLRPGFTDIYYVLNGVANTSEGLGAPYDALETHADNGTSKSGTNGSSIGATATGWTTNITSANPGNPTSAANTVRFQVPGAMDDGAGGSVRPTMKVSFVTEPADLLKNNQVTIGGTVVTAGTAAAYPTAGWDGTAQTLTFTANENSDAFKNANTASAASGGSINFTFEYVYDSLAYQAFSTTWVHPTPGVQAGSAFIGTQSSGARAFRISTYTFLTGIHTATGGNAASKFMNRGTGTYYGESGWTIPGGSDEGNVANKNADSGIWINPLYLQPNLGQNYGRGYTNTRSTGGAMRIDGDWGSRGTFVPNDENYFAASFTTGTAGGVFFDNAVSSGVSHFNRGGGTVDGYDAEVTYGGIPTATLAVDVSRYGGASWNKIPFLSVGAMIMDWDYNGSRSDPPVMFSAAQNTPRFFEVKYVESVSTSNRSAANGFITFSGSDDLFLTQSSDTYRPRDNEAAGLLAPRAGSVPTSAGYNHELVKLPIATAWEARTWLEQIESREDTTFQTYLWFDVNAVDKGSLREGYVKARNTFRVKDLYDLESWNDYRDQMFQAGTELGRIMTPTTGYAAWNTTITTLAGRLDKDKERANGSLGGKDTIYESDMVWETLYKPELGKNNENLNTGSVNKTVSYATHYKLDAAGNRTALQFYANPRIGFEDISLADYDKLFTADGDTSNWVTGTKYVPGPNGAIGQAYLPSQYYIENAGQSNAKLIPTLPYGTIPADSPPNSDPASAAYLAWKQAWADLHTVYPAGSFVVINDGGTRKLVPLAVPNEITVKYPNDSNVATGEVPSIPGYYFELRNADTDALITKGKLDRWGVDKDQTRQGTFDGDIFVTGLNTFPSGQKAPFDIDDANRLTVLKQNYVYGRLRYDYFYYPKNYTVKFTNKGAYEPGAETQGGTAIVDFTDNGTAATYDATYRVDHALNDTLYLPNGKHFVGWYLPETGKTYTPGTASETIPAWLYDSGDITFYAVFADNETSVLIDGNGGTFDLQGLWDGTDGTNGLTYIDSSAVPPTLGHVTGANAADFAGISSFQSATLPIWVTKLPGITNLRRVGYQFWGWEVQNGGSGYAITDSQSRNAQFSSFGTNFVAAAAPYTYTFGDASATLVAQWKPKTYQVMYYSDVGANPASLTNLTNTDTNFPAAFKAATYGQPYSVPSSSDYTPPARPGFTFIGWVANYTGTNLDDNNPNPDPLYAAGASFTGNYYYDLQNQTFLSEAREIDDRTTFKSVPPANDGTGILRFYAVYQENSVVITYDLDGGSYQHYDPDTDTITYPTQPILSDRTVKVSQQYKVFGESPSKENAGAFLGFELYRGGVKVDPSSGTYWLPEDVLWNSNGTPAVTGLAGAKVLDGNDFAGTDPELVLKAVYGPQNTVEIVFKPNAPSTPVAKTDDDVQNMPYRYGAGAPAEYKTTIVQGKQLTLGATAPGVDETLNGGEPALEGYRFNGWQLTYSVGGKNRTVTLQNVSIKAFGYALPTGATNFEMVAQWVAISDVTLRYHPNGGVLFQGQAAQTNSFWTDPDPAHHQTAGSPFSFLLAENNATRPGYTMKGWATSSTAAEADKVIAGTTPVSASYTDLLTIYAIWAGITNGVTVTLNVNGGSPIYGKVEPDGTTPSIITRTATAGQTYGSFNQAQLDAGAPQQGGVIPANDPTRAGYTFGGWEIDASGSALDKTVVTGASTVTLPGSTTNIVLVAKWTVAPGGSNLYYNLNDVGPNGSVGTGGASYAAGKGAGPYAVTVGTDYDTYVGGGYEPSRPGYTFGGWFLTSACDGAQQTATTSITLTGVPAANATTLYAKWTPTGTNGNGPLTVTFDLHGGVVLPSTTSLPNWTNVVAETAYKDQLTGGAFPAAVRAGYSPDYDGNTAVTLFTAATGTANSIKDTDPVRPTGSTTIALHYRWTAIPSGVKIVYHPVPGSATNGGLTFAADELGTAGTKYSTLQHFGDIAIGNTTVRTGYTFDGWKVGTPKAGESYTYDSLTGIVLNGATDDITPNPAATGNPVEIHLYGTWTVTNGAEVTIVRHTRGGAITGSDPTVAPGDVIGEIGTPVKAGFLFAGWSSVDPDVPGNTASLLPAHSAHAADLAWTGAKAEYPLLAPDADEIHVYATWQYDPTHQIKLVFDAQGGVRPTARPANPITLLTDGMPADQAYILVNAGSLLPTNQTAPKTDRSGYVWDGNWYRSQTNNSTPVPWSTFEIVADDPEDTSTNPVCTVYAIWPGSAVTNGTTVYWDANGGIYGNDTSKTMKTWTGETAGTIYNEAVNYPDTQYAATDSTKPYYGLPLPTRSGWTFYGWKQIVDENDPSQDISIVYDTTEIQPLPAANPANVTLLADWGTQGDADAVKVVYDPNGGVETSAGFLNDKPDLTAGLTYTAQSVIVDGSIVKRAGYVFDGWYQDVDTSAADPFAGKTPVSGSTNVDPAPNAQKDGNYYVITLTAKWKASTDTKPDGMVLVYWNANGGNAVPTTNPNPQRYIANALFGSAPSPSRPGYTLINWYTTELKANPLGSTTTIAVASISAAHVEPDPTLTPDGSNDVTVNMLAGWQAVPKGETGCVIIHFVPNGGTDVAGDKGVLNQREAEAGKTYLQNAIDLDSSLTVRGGYTFLGWWTAQGTSPASSDWGTQVTAGSTVAPSLSSNEITLYAKWSAPAPNGITITYHPNGGTDVMGNDGVNQSKATAGDYYGALAASSLTWRPGWTFQGWYTSAAFGGSPVDPDPTNGTKVSAVPLTGDTVDLYAKWGITTANEGKITLVFNPQGGTPTPASVTGLTANSQYGPLPSVTRAGYTANAGNKWYTLSSAGVNVLWNSTIEPLQFYNAADPDHDGFEEDELGNITLTLYTHWMAIPNGVHVSFTGGAAYTGAVITPETEFWAMADEIYGLNENALTNLSNQWPTATLPGYSFNGWYLVPHEMLSSDHPLVPQTELEPITANDIVTLVNAGSAEIILYAHFDPRSNGTKVNLRDPYVPDNASFVEPYFFELTVEGPYYRTGGLATVDPAKPGFEFNGHWYLSIADAKARNDNYVTDETLILNGAEHNIYAGLRYRNDIVVTFVPGEGTLKDDEKSKFVTLDEPYGWLPSPTRKGYQFLGWYNDDGVLITKDSIVDNGNNHNLYAAWGEIGVIYVIFDARGGIVSPRNKEVVHGAPYGSLPTPFLPGFSFKGWYTMPVGGDKVTADTRVSIPATHTIYAHWEYTGENLPVIPAPVVPDIPIVLPDIPGINWPDIDWSQLFPGGKGGTCNCGSNACTCDSGSGCTCGNCSGSTEEPNGNGLDNNGNGDNGTDPGFPDTGDHLPIALLVALLLGSAGTFFLLRKKEDDEA
jgi:uncharacterized repeat protein (TIGR02543 family)